ncbi:hypothetical protein C0J52_26809 [Blattella germanica]|nr:hypothetical protein C0J52_26809 [Blattella germanica]
MCSVSVVLFTVLALCLSSSLVNAECNPGESQLTDFDYKKFTGHWHILSSNSEEFSKYCWDDDYEEGPDGTVLNSDYTCPNGSRIQETAKVDLQGSKFDLEYPDHTLIYVQYRDTNDREAKKDEVGEILKKYNVDYDKLYCSCSC